MSCMSPEQAMLTRGVGVAQCKGSIKEQVERTKFQGKFDGKGVRASCREFRARGELRAGVAGHT